MKKSDVQFIRLLFGVIAWALTVGHVNVFAQTKAAAPLVITVYKTPT